MENHRLSLVNSPINGPFSVANSGLAPGQSEQGQRILRRADEEAIFLNGTFVGFTMVLRHSPTFKFRLFETNEQK